jgi:hypothetical protein
MSQSSSEASLLQKITARKAGICLYGFAPPKRSAETEELARIAAQQRARLQNQRLDGLVIYDIQDETERTREPRPFPFLPTLAPEAYAREHLAELGLPHVIYHSVAGDDRSSFSAWLAANAREPALAVLVGAASAAAAGSLGLRAAYELARAQAPELILGGIAIAERHARKLDEHERMLGKAALGCRFFVTQAVYDVTSTLSLLSDYALGANDSSATPAPIILTFSPCGSAKTLAFMKWLGIGFPRWLENELRFSPDPLSTSMKLCERIFAEVWDFAADKHIPLGVNVESVSIRKAEIEASLELSRVLSGFIERRLAAGP